MWTISKEFNFDAAHSLPHLPPEHKCHHLHGHTYKVAIRVRGDLKEQWVVDYAEISRIVMPIIKMLDHKNLNDVLVIPTTAENIAYWIWTRIGESLNTNTHRLYSVDVYETTGTCCSYCPRP